MGDFKEKNGHSRASAIWQGVKKIAPDVVQAVGSLTGVEALKKASELMRSPEYDNKRESVDLLLEQIDYEIALESNITERHKNDMVSDSWLSKNIRPMSLIFLTVFFALIVVIDSSSVNFNVKIGYLELLGSLIIMVYGFYFVGREVQKAIKNYKQ